MVNVRVNLLKNRRSLTEKEYRREQLIFRSAVLGLTVIVFVTMAFSVWNWLLSRRLLSIESNITQASNAMKDLTEANAQQIYLKSRLKLISAFIEERSISRESMEKVFSLSIPGANISSLTFLSETVISIQVTAGNVAVLNQAIAYYESDNSFFTQVVSRGVSRTKDGKYELELELTIPKEGA